MTATSHVRPLVHRKQPEVMTPSITTTAAGISLVPSYITEVNQAALLVAGQTLAWLYMPMQDSWQQLPSPAFTSALAAGASGTWMPGGPTGTTSAATSTSITTNFTSIRSLRGCVIRLTGGTGAGQERVIAPHNIGTNTVFNVTLPWTTNPDATTTWEVRSGRFYFLNGGTVAAAQWRVYDVATNTWSSLGTTGLPSGFATDANMVSQQGEPWVAGTATSGGANTLTNSEKSWATNQWANAQVRITRGTGAGQVRTIASNTATVLTVSSNWSVNPDATSEYVIEGNEDFLYLMGNNAVTLYRFSISGNTWTTLTPGVARAGAPVAGCMSFVPKRCKSAPWLNESAFLNGRYIYSFRGGGASTLDVYDIAANSWSNSLSYGFAGETFSTGSSLGTDGIHAYIQKDNTGRIFRFSPEDQDLIPVETLQYTQSTGVVGNKSMVVSHLESDVELPFFYTLLNGSTIFMREWMY